VTTNMIQENGTITSMQQLKTHDGLQENDVVLVQPYCTLNVARVAGHCDVCPVLKIYNKEEEDFLVTSGAKLPQG